MEPVSLAELKSHLRVEDDDEDTLLRGLLTAARLYVERAQRRSFVNTTWTWTLDEFPSGYLRPPRSPLSSVTSIAYVDTDGTSQTWDSDEYDVDTSVEPGRIEPAYGYSYPATYDQMEAVTVTFVAGYGTADDVPEATKVAIKMLVGHWYEHREAYTEVQGVSEVPFAVKALIDIYAVVEAA